MTFKSVSLNLGCHLTSAEAASALDLGRCLLQGSEYLPFLSVLSRTEIIGGLRAAGAPIGHGDRVDPLVEFRVNEVTKKWFESMVEDALTSLGGKDYQLSDILSKIDGEKKICIATDMEEEKKRKHTPPLPHHTIDSKASADIQSLRPVFEEAPGLNIGAVANTGICSNVDDSRNEH